MEHTSANRGSRVARDENASKDRVKDPRVGVEQFEAAIGHAVAHADELQIAFVHRILYEWKGREVFQRDPDGLVFQRGLTVAF